MIKEANRTSHEYVFRLGAIVLTVFVVYVAKPVLVPLALAILLAFILSPVVSLGQRIGLGRVPSTLLTLAIAAGIAVTLAMVVGSQVAKLAGELPNHQAEIEAKLDRIRSAGTGGPFSRLVEMVHELAQKPAEARRGRRPSAPRPGGRRVESLADDCARPPSPRTGGDRRSGRRADGVHPAGPRGSAQPVPCHDWAGTIDRNRARHRGLGRPHRPLSAVPAPGQRDSWRAAGGRAGSDGCAIRTLVGFPGGASALHSRSSGPGLR